VLYSVYLDSIAFTVSSSRFTGVLASHSELIHVLPFPPSSALPDLLE
jgi:hypothetical protein